MRGRLHCPYAFYLIYDVPWIPDPGAVDALAARVVAALGDGKHVVVNCSAGLNRSGLLVARSLILLGNTREADCEGRRRLLSAPLHRQHRGRNHASHRWHHPGGGARKSSECRTERLLSESVAVGESAQRLRRRVHRFSRGLKLHACVRLSKHCRYAVESAPIFRSQAVAKDEAGGALGRRRDAACLGSVPGRCSRRFDGLGQGALRLGPHPPSLRCQCAGTHCDCIRRPSPTRDSIQMNTEQ